MAGPHPPLEGEGRLTMSEATREAGWGDVSTLTGVRGEITPPRSPASRADRPSPSRGGRHRVRGTIRINKLRTHLGDIRLGDARRGPSRGLAATLPWRGRVASRGAKRNVRRGGVMSPHAPAFAETSPHPARPLRVRSTLPLQGRVAPRSWHCRDQQTQNSCQHAPLLSRRVSRPSDASSHPLSEARVQGRPDLD